MPEPKMISPMLDNFIMGGAMSEHHGVRCYPAIENETGDRYIVKVISVPATPSQLDALLLTGAYSDKASALSYFAEMAQATLEEVDTLEKLTELEGFTAYSACQMVPMETGDGFDIYLLGTYKRALDKYFQRHSFTHLDALNLGIDLCSALSVSRRLGYLYIDLKPSNVYVNEQKQFQIGDLGFIRLDSLKYASVPEKYISTYTPPEIQDAFSLLNDTMDVYAVGLILYQAYNNGELPFNTEIRPGDSLPAPLYADYEMSEIILKACAVNPEDRWDNPTQMGQAIISYMQRNGAADTPIVPMPVPTAEQDASVSDEISTEDVELIPSPAVIQTAESEYSQAETAPESTQDHATAETDETAAAQVAAEGTAETEKNEVIDGGVTPAVNEELSDADSDEESIDETSEDIALTDEVSEMLNQADELATMAVPEPVVAPDYVEVPVPVPAESEIPAQSAANEESDSEPETNETATEISGEAQAEITASEDTEDMPADGSDEAPAKKRRWVGKLVCVVLLVALLIGGYFFYKEYYIVPIQIQSIEGDRNTLTVRISAEIDESKLTVICSGDYGIKFTAPVVDGQAEFTELVPNTAYSIQVEVNGFHKLVGNTKSAYSTPAQTNVLQFDAITGDTEDSAILTFTVEGPSCEKWSVFYSAEGEEQKSAVFTEHMVTLSHLTVGKAYTFRLVPDSELYMTGQSSITFTPRPIVKPQNLQATGCVNNTLSVAWDTPDNSVESWSVHCYNDTYNQTIITTETYAAFTGLDHTAGYTVEVKAAGMSKGEDIVVPANSVTAENFKIDTSDPTKLNITWSATQEIPAQGWSLRYSVVGINNEEVIPCSTNAGVITPVIPNATYKIRLEDPNGNVLLNSVRTIITGEPVSFQKEFNDIVTQASDLEFNMCKTPNIPGWGRLDVPAKDYRSTFTVGESASFLVRFDKLYNAPKEDVTIMYVTYNQNGTIIHSGVQINNWKKMWTGSNTYCKLTVPVMPGTIGEYRLDIYFNGMFVHKQAFTVKQ